MRLEHLKGPPASVGRGRTTHADQQRRAHGFATGRRRSARPCRWCRPSTGIVVPLCRRPGSRPDAMAISMAAVAPPSSSNQADATGSPSGPRTGHGARGVLAEHARRILPRRRTPGKPYRPPSPSAAAAPAMAAAPLPQPVFALPRNLSGAMTTCGIHTWCRARKGPAA